MSEEERRRCIITGACAGASREESLAEELYVADHGVAVEGRWKSLKDTLQEAYRRQAAYMLAHYRFAGR